MQKDNDESFELVDLGAVSVETKGSCTGIFEVVGYVLPQGLSDE